MTAWQTSAPPPGWYPDPENPANLRWWDGAAWTDHRAPAWQPPTGPVGAWAGPGHVAGGPSHDLDWVLPVNRDGFAIAAGYFGLFSFIPNPVTSIAAIAFAWIALKRIPKTGKMGRGRAFFGLIAGACSLFLFSLFVLASIASHGQS